MIRHLSYPPWRLRRMLPERSLRAIAEAIACSEQRSSGEICVAIEVALNWRRLLRGQSPRERALEVFAQLRVWDTERNNGVLIYLLMADRDVEIVADRGIDRWVGKEAWERICREMEQAFLQGQFESGILLGVQAVGEQLARHFPRQGQEANELPDRPVILE